MEIKKTELESGKSKVSEMTEQDVTDAVRKLENRSHTTLFDAFKREVEKRSAVNQLLSNKKVMSGEKDITEDLIRMAGPEVVTKAERDKFDQLAIELMLEDAHTGSAERKAELQAYAEQVINECEKSNIEQPWWAEKILDNLAAR